MFLKKSTNHTLIISISQILDLFYIKVYSFHVVKFDQSNTSDYKAI